MSRNALAILSVLSIGLIPAAAAQCNKPCAAKLDKAASCCRSNEVQQAQRDVYQVECRIFVAEVHAGKIIGMSLADDGCAEPGFDFREIARAMFTAPGLASKTNQDFMIGITQEAEDLRALVHNLQHRGLARVLADPTILTCNGRTGSIAVVAEMPVTDMDRSFVEVQEHGIRLECTPYVVEHDRVRVNVRSEIKSLGLPVPCAARGFESGANTTREVSRPNEGGRHFSTAAELNAGESLVFSVRCAATCEFPAHPTACRASSLLTAATSSASLQTLMPSSYASDVSLTTGSLALTASHSEEKDLIILVTTNVLEPNGAERAANEQVGTIQLVAAETDAEGPHPPAILLTPAGAVYESSMNAAVPQAQISKLSPGKPHCAQFSSECASSNSSAADPNTPCLQKSMGQGCPTACREELGGSQACRETTDCIRRRDCASDPLCQASDIEAFIEQVLSAQMQYLDGMVRTRLEYERKMLETKAAAEAALAKQAVKHAEEMWKLRTEHMAEVRKLNEAAWADEKEAIAARYEQAIEYERELAELRQSHAESVQARQIAVLEGELRELRDRAKSTESDRVAQSPDTSRQSSSNRRRVPVELPVHVEDLSSGRVRYAPLPRNPDHIMLDDPLIAVEPVEFSTPPISTGRTVWQELDCLRRDVHQLRAIVDDMLCVTPDVPPAPMPEAPGGDCDEP